ncbi:hypothetical protein OHE95_25290 [Escherichia coli]|nr:hypothetical protein [Escherichia coli]MCT6427824.1 hypothetical protein [Escherichia coli]MCT6427829.1 hypothetical protein [Escherichia coli]MCV2939625.1 hypothetical protein [Escherichia coli]
MLNSIITVSEVESTR